MITLENDRLVFRFPDLGPDAEFEVSFQRTLRIPDDGRDHFLPPGLGDFPVRHVDDYTAKLPKACAERGGVLLPMYQAEALWLSFPGRGWGDCPMAIKIGTGKINAVTGAPWASDLHAEPQDYLVAPLQPWLDGYCVEKGVVRQFVAAPPGRNITVEEQLTGGGNWGGIQIAVYPMNRERYRKWRAERAAPKPRFLCDALCEETPFLGVAAGGRMRQHIYEDEYGLDAWDQRHSSRCFVTILDSRSWAAITGEAMPTEPVSAKEYTKHGLPWFDYYSEAAALAGSARLNSIKSTVAAWQGASPAAAEFAAPLPSPKVKRLGRGPVREMRS